jgi:hypothetical protein
MKSHKFGLKLVFNQVKLKQNLHFLKIDPKIQLPIIRTVFN